MAGRRGKKRALVAVGHSLLVTGYTLITRQVDYQDLGANYFDERNKEAVKRRTVKRLEQLGFQVELKSLAANYRIIELTRTSRSDSQSLDDQAIANQFGYAAAGRLFSGEESTAPAAGV